MADPVLVVEGMDELQRKFRGLSRKARRVSMRKVMRRAARVVVTEARKNMLRRTGFAAANVAVTVSAKDDTHVEAEIGPRRKAFYAGILEVGTASFTPKPWLRPALWTKRTAVLERMAKAMKAEFMKVARGIGI